MQIPQNIVNRVLSAADIIEVITEDIKLQKKGKNYVGICPFHSDTTPSLCVSKSMGIYKCFACGEGGNVVKWTMKNNSLSFTQAVRYLGRKFGVEVPEEEMTDEQKKEARQIEDARNVLNYTKNLYQQEFKTNANAIDYVINKRHISMETAEIFAIGYTDGKIKTELIKDGYKEEVIQHAGLLNDKGKDFFFNRIMFPFFDKFGNVIGFTGRTLTEQGPKYLNSRDLKGIFNKGNFLYGLYQAKKTITKNNKIYVCEGQFDVIGLYNVGVTNAVAGSGTALTDYQRRLIKAYTTNIVFVYDSDNAGVNAAIKNLETLIAEGFSVRCVDLKEIDNVKDPADLAEKLGQGTSNWLEKHEQNYVFYLADKLYFDVKNENDRADGIKRILNIIAKDSVLVQDQYIRQLEGLTKIKEEKLNEYLHEIAVPSKDKFVKGFLGIEFVDKYVTDRKEIFLTSDYEVFTKHFGKEEPYIFYSGMPTEGEIQELSNHAQTFIFKGPECDATSTYESNDLILMKKMFMHGLTIHVETEETSSIVSFYIGYYGDLIKESNPVEEVKNSYILRCAELVSYTKPAIQTVNMSTWANALGLKITTMKEIVKPFLAERKAESKKNVEIGKFNDNLMEYNTSSVPKYVEENEEYKQMLENFKFYPVLNKQGEPVCYMFRTEQGGYKRVGDFYMEPLMHVYSKTKEENRRIIKVNRARSGGSIYLEWPSQTFVKLSSVKDMLILEEHLNFENCSPVDYEHIWSQMSYGFTTCNELKVLGQQLEGCWCFANAIFHEVEGEWKFELADELGLMKHGKQIFYSPSYSIVNAGMRYDKDPFEMDKRLSFIDTPAEKRTTFKHWAELMNEVYKINDNGKWAILYAILCTFRSEIYHIDRTFTALFFIGQTESGKTQIAISIRSLFMHPKTQNMNLNSASDAAFFSILEKYRDVPVVMEEYNDEEISAIKFQGLKSCIYDGDGKEKRKSASTNDIDSSAVNAPIILLGQEAPQRDDGSLANRVILLQVDKKVSFSEHEQNIFNELKQFEKDGLSYLLIEVLKLRNKIREEYATTYRRCKNEFEQKLIRLGKRTGSQNRIINTISFFLAICKIVEDEPNLPLPFTNKEFMEVAIKKISKQVEMITQSDKLGVFFSVLDASIDSKDVLIGRDFRIEKANHVKLAGGEEKFFENETNLIYMNMKSMYDKYVKNIDRSEKPIKQSTLAVNIESSPAYVGKVKNYRFRWKATKEVETKDLYDGGNEVMTRILVDQERQTSAIVMNYDLLKKVMDIDFERDSKFDLEGTN